MNSTTQTIKFVSDQKVIKVGDSLAVTVPARIAKQLNTEQGETLTVTFERSEIEQHTLEVVALTQKLIKRHEQALKNLSQR